MAPSSCAPATRWCSPRHRKLEPREGADFFPLTVDVEERMYAAGKIPGGFFKREGRPTERAILNAHDRPADPTALAEGFRNEVQVIATVLSADKIVAHDVLAMNGASAALAISSLPFLGPVGAVRIGMDDDGRLIVDPTLPELLESSLDLLVVGTKDAITMVECGAEEVPEDTIIAALEAAHREIRGICEAQEELRALAGKPKFFDTTLTAELEAWAGVRIRERIAAEDSGRRPPRWTSSRRAAPAMSMSRPRTTPEADPGEVPLGAIVEKARLRGARARPAAVRDRLRALTDAEQD
jgi:polyribonucleotide nucleotidyltransferase